MLGVFSDGDLARLRTLAKANSNRCMVSKRKARYDASLRTVVRMLAITACLAKLGAELDTHITNLKTTKEIAVHAQQAIQVLQQCFQVTLDAASAQNKLSDFLPKQAPTGRVVVVGAGKGAAAMAAELERVWPYPEVALSGLVITRYEHTCPTQYIEVVEASHPVPDGAGEAAAKRILASVQGLQAEDLVIALMSGGASALLSLPCAGISLQDKRAVNKALLHSGAPIEHMNAVRKHLSAIKGGRLAQAAAPAQVLTLAISDVVGDDLSVIGSGPTVTDATTFADVRRIIDQYDIDLPPAVAAYLQAATVADETPKTLPNSTAHLVVTPNQALMHTEAWAKAQGLNVLYLGDQISGESKEVAQVMAGIAKHIATQNLPIAKPALLLSGGETTVTVKNPHGKGGRNTAFLLALANALQGQEGVYALAADTDGIDGSEDNAGAWLAPETWQQGKDLGLDAEQMLQQDLAYGYFEALHQLLVTGPTRTNINDVRALLIV